MKRVLKLIFSAIFLYIALQLTRFLDEAMLRFIVWTTITFITFLYIAYINEEKPQFNRRLFDNK